MSSTDAVARPCCCAATAAACSLQPEATPVLQGAAASARAWQAKGKQSQAGGAGAAPHLEIDAGQVCGLSRHVERNHRPHHVASHILFPVALHVHCQAGGEAGPHGKGAAAAQHECGAEGRDAAQRRQRRRRRAAMGWRERLAAGLRAVASRRFGAVRSGFGGGSGAGEPGQRGRGAADHSPLAAAAAGCSRYQGSAADVDGMDSGVHLSCALARLEGSRPQAASPSCPLASTAHRSWKGGKRTARVWAPPPLQPPPPPSPPPPAAMPSRAAPRKMRWWDQP